MDFFEREYLVSRVLSGELNWTGKYTVYPADLSIQYNSQEIFRKSFYEAQSLGLVSDDDLTEICLEKGFISEKDVIFLGFAQKEVENFQRELYLNRKKVDNVRKIKKLISLNRDRHVSILNKINKYNSFTVEGYANYCKIDYILRNTTFNRLNKKKCSFKKINIQRLVSFYTENIILPSTIRYLSRTQPWSNMWAAFKVNGVVFPQGSQMTLQQQLMLMWSRMYDSIQESAEPPEMDVIEDDDMLDGWLSIQHDEKDKKQEKVSSKVSQAQEQYIIANNIDEAKEIEKRNSPEMIKVKNQREKCIKERGEVRECELPDVKRKLLIEKNRLSTQVRK